MGAQTLERIVNSVEELSPKERNCLPKIPERKEPRNKYSHVEVGDYVIRAFIAYERGQLPLLSNTFFAEQLGCRANNVKLALTKVKNQEKRLRRSKKLNRAALDIGRAVHKETRELTENFTRLQTIAAHITENWYRHIIFGEPLKTNKSFAKLYKTYQHSISALTAKYMNPIEKTERSRELHTRTAEKNFQLNNPKELERKYVILRKARAGLSKNEKKKLFN